jgi:hypothetical protein
MLGGLLQAKAKALNTFLRVRKWNRLKSFGKKGGRAGAVHYSVWEELNAG